MLCIPGDPECPVPGTPPTLKVLYKIVDSSNIDPNGRIGSPNSGMKNWKVTAPTSGENAVKKKIEMSDTFNPNNLEYSFDLDSGTIKKIREYNDLNTDYLDYNGYVCDSTDVGDYCKSSFINNAVADSYAEIKYGREKWQKYDYDTNLVTIVDKR